MHRVELKGVFPLLPSHTSSSIRFLMHRVELKAQYAAHYKISLKHVPNAPCGVESKMSSQIWNCRRYRFLMHRVELKDKNVSFVITNIAKFLMHRVELKELSKLYSNHAIEPVPNAPCGVESALCCN